MPLLRCLPLLLLSVLPVPIHAQSFAPVSTHALFDSEFRRVLAETEVPGAAYAIVVDGRIEMARGFGVREVGGNDPVSADTVFRIASVSKTFAAHLAAMLVADGRLSWNQPLASFAPDFRLKNNSQQRIQLRHVLGQSAGLVPNAFDNLVDAGQSLDQILPQFRSLEPSCAPGRCYGYQNILYGMSARAIEHAAGQSYGNLLAQRVFAPLGMHHASVGLAALLAETDSAKPHIRRDGQWLQVDVEENYYQLPAAAGVNASANDLAKWLIAQMGGFPDTVRPADVATVTQARVTTAKDLRRGEWKDLLSSAHYGLGWRIYRIGDDPILLHAGWVKGYVAEISYSPRLRTGLVVLLNGESGRALNELGSQFWRRELEAFPALPVASGNAINTPGNSATTLPASTPPSAASRAENAGQR